MNSKINSLTLFIKGLCMGIADIIPGVSGGTIALIMGIYEKLIFSIRNIKLTFNIKQLFKSIDFNFFIPLILGIGIAFLSLSHLLTSLIENYPGLIYAFFFGLILGSIYFIYRQIKEFNWKILLSSLVGFMLSFWIVGINQIQPSHSPLTIFISGAIAIIAMILPGISGSFILLTLGQYEYMIEAISNLDFVIIILFILGALFGLLSFVRVVSYLLKRHEHLTLAFLTGVMIGALRLPYYKISVSLSLGSSFLFIIILGIVGFVVVILLENLSSTKFINE